MKEINCKVCDKLFSRKTSQIGAGYCSQKCSGIGHRGIKRPEHSAFMKRVGMFVKSKSDGNMKSLHIWMRRRIPKPELCQHCQIEPPRDLANISQEYIREIHDWIWLCRKCHIRQDGRINNLKKYWNNAESLERDIQGRFIKKTI